MGSLDAVPASWTIEAEEDGPVPHLTPQRTIRTDLKHLPTAERA